MNRILCYLEYMTPGLAAGALAWLLFRLRRRRTGGGPRSWAMLLFWMYSGGMAVITLAPEPWWVNFALGGRQEPYFDLSGLAYRVSLVPFSQPDSLFNIIGNIVMFLPFGVFAALLWRGSGWKRALALGLGITCGIECWQLFVGRYFDIDDIILNTLGVFCGYLLWRGLRRLAPQFAGRFHTMDILELVEPTMDYKDQVLAFKAEMLEYGGGFDGCAGLEDTDTYEEWLDFRGREARKGWVLSNTWLTVRKSDNRVVGIIDCRSALTDFLRQYGGHIGYCVRPTERRKGCAVEQLRLALEKYREAGEKRVLVICDKSNTASRRTILANGGVLENEVEDQPGLGESGILQRYWITL